MRCQFPAQQDAVTPTRPQLDLLRLPCEIRLMIYEYILVECPRWDKRHNANCRYKPVGTAELEAPPFLMVNITLSETDRIIKTRSFCNCAKRNGLALLQTSRMINREASPVFWSKNTFCFLDARDFTVAVGHILRANHRERIRSVSIMNPDRKGFTSHILGRRGRSGQILSSFWDVVSQCTQLRTLEIPPRYIKHDVCRVQQVAQKLTGLQFLDLTQLIPYCQKDTVYGYPYPSPNFSIYQTTYARFSHRVLLEKYLDQKAIAELRSELANLRLDVDTAIKVQFLGADLNQLEDWRRTFTLAPDLHELSSTRHLTLLSGDTTLITFYGLPLSGHTKSQKLDKFHLTSLVTVDGGRQRGRIIHTAPAE